MLCVQEGERDATGEIAVEHGYWIVQSAREQVGTPCLIFQDRLGKLIRTHNATQHYVLVEVALSPPVLFCSLYLPPRSHRQDLFDLVLHSFQSDIEVFQKRTPGLLVIGGGDLNTQLAAQAGPTGKFVGGGDRPGEQDRSDHILATFAHLALRLPNTFSPYGPTRRSWEGKLDRDSASTIDFLFSTKTVVTLLWPERHPPTGISSDHRPIGAGFLAPFKRTKRDRQRLHTPASFSFAPPSRRLHAQWAPANQIRYDDALRHLKFASLDDVAPQIHDAASTAKSQDTEAQIIKRHLLTQMRQTTDPDLRAAYQSSLQDFQWTQRENREQRRLLEWAQAKASPRPPEGLSATHLRRSRRSLPMGTAIFDFYSNLYKATPLEAHRVLESLWKLQNQATKAKDLLLCDATELRDIVKTMPGGKAAGPDGLPSQCIRSLPVSAISQLAKLFTTLANDCSYTSEHCYTDHPSGRTQTPFSWQKSPARARLTDFAP